MAEKFQSRPRPHARSSPNSCIDNADVDPHAEPVQEILLPAAASAASAAFAAVAHSFEEVAVLLMPLICDQAIDDAALAKAVLTEHVSLPPLNRHEFAVLACGLYTEKNSARSNTSYTYRDVDELTARFSPSGLPMNTTMIYKTFRSLVSRGLVDEVGRGLARYNRPSDHFVVTADGKAAFRLAIANAFHLENCRRSKAA